MTKILITGNAAAAHAAKLAKPQYIPTYPITPQTEVIETLELWRAVGKLPDSDVHQLESEHSVMSAAISASATGSRTFTATSSQGLLLMHEMLYIASGMRLPIVMVNISRGVSAPITLWPDHQDFLGCRDTGWIMLHAKNNQEVLDFTIMAYAIAEHPDVLLPVMINMDGYTLSYTEEPVELPEQDDINWFLGTYHSDHNIASGHHLGVGAPCMAEYYSEFKIQQCIAMEIARAKIKDTFEMYGKLTGRYYNVVDYQPGDSDIVLVSQGSMSTTVRYTAKKYKVGTLNLPVIRPFPYKEIVPCLLGGMDKVVAVLDQNVMPGRGGIMFQEIKECLYHYDTRPEMLSFIVGLGGVPQTEEKIKAIIDKVKNNFYFADEIDFTDAD